MSTRNDWLYNRCFLKSPDFGRLEKSPASRLPWPPWPPSARIARSNNGICHPFCCFWPAPRPSRPRASPRWGGGPSARGWRGGRRLPRLPAWAASAAAAAAAAAAADAAAAAQAALRTARNWPWQRLPLPGPRVWRRLSKAGAWCVMIIPDSLFRAGMGCSSRLSVSAACNVPSLNFEQLQAILKD